MGQDGKSVLCAATRISPVNPRKASLVAWSGRRVALIVGGNGDRASIATGPATFHRSFARVTFLAWACESDNDERSAENPGPLPLARSRGDRAALH